MKPLLHIIRKDITPETENIIKTQTLDNAYGVSIVYLQEGKHPHLAGARIYQLVKDKSPLQTGESSVEYITYDELIDLITSSESITVW